MVLMTVVALLAAACSSDSSDPTTSTTDAATTTTSSTTSAAPTTTTSAAVTTTTVAVPVTLSPSDPFVTTGGMGAIRVGMGVEEAAAAAGFELSGEPDPNVSDTCYHVIAPDDEAAYADVSFMVVDDVIVRVEIRGDSTATTRSGAGIGISETSLRAMFPGQLEDAEYSAGGGGGLEFVPKDEEDVQYRVQFAIEGGVVTEYRAGVLPAVAFTEGCV